MTDLSPLVDKLGNEVVQLKRELALKDDTIRMLAARCKGQSDVLARLAEKPGAHVPRSFSEWWEKNKKDILRGATQDVHEGNVS